MFFLFISVFSSSHNMALIVHFNLMLTFFCFPIYLLLMSFYAAPITIPSIIYRTLIIYLNVQLHLSMLFSSSWSSIKYVPFLTIKSKLVNSSYIAYPIPTAAEAQTVSLNIPNILDHIMADIQIASKIFSNSVAVSKDIGELEGP